MSNNKYDMSNRQTSLSIVSKLAAFILYNNPSWYKITRDFESRKSPVILLLQIQINREALEQLLPNNIINTYCNLFAYPNDKRTCLLSTIGKRFANKQNRYGVQSNTILFLLYFVFRTDYDISVFCNTRSLITYSLYKLHGFLIILRDPRDSFLALFFFIFTSYPQDMDYQMKNEKNFKQLVLSAITVRYLPTYFIGQL